MVMGMREKLVELLITLMDKDGCRIVGTVLAMKISDHLIANGVTIPVRCKDCKYRRDDVNCPMCFEEEKEWDDDGYTEVDWITHDHTHDDGYCYRGERRTDA
jgi:hypothetical protein